MVAQGHGGSIIGVSSISALVGGSEQTHYTPTKAGILSLMQSCACALGKHGIRCNALLPGTIKTGMNEADLAEPGKREYIEKRTPLGRTGVPGDLAGPTVFLGSDMSGYVVSCFLASGDVGTVLIMVNVDGSTITGGRRVSDLRWCFHSLIATRTN